MCAALQEEHAGKELVKGRSTWAAKSFYRRTIAPLGKGGNTALL